MFDSSTSSLVLLLTSVESFAQCAVHIAYAWHMPLVYSTVTGDITVASCGTPASAVLVVDCLHDVAVLGRLCNMCTFLGTLSKWPPAGLSYFTL